jgi:hypothetical protein
VNRLKAYECNDDNRVVIEEMGIGVKMSNEMMGCLFNNEPRMAIASVDIGIEQML